MALTDESGRRLPGYRPPPPPPPKDPYTAYYQGYGIDPNSPQGQMVRDLIKDGELVDEAFDIIADRFNLGPYSPKPDTSGVSGAASAAASLAESKRQFDIDFAENQRQFNAAQAAGDRREAARLKAEREAMLRGELNDLRQARISERMKAREQGTQLAGTDPFRTLGQIRARAVQGPTMVDQFKGELAQAASFQEPMLGPGASVADLESAIAKMAQPITPQGGGPFSAFRPPGLEHGGTVSKEEVQPFTMGRPHPKTAIEFAKKAGMTTVMTGERSGGPELVIGKEFTVIPLTDQEEEELMTGPFSPPKAQAGVTVGGFEGAQDLFESLRESVGITGGLRERAQGNNIIPFETAAKLGAFQRAPGSLLRNSQTGQIYTVDETGRLRWVRNPATLSSSLFAGKTSEEFGTDRAWQLGRFQQGEDILGGPFSLPTGTSGGALGEPLTTLRGFSEIPGMSADEAARLSDLIGFLPRTPPRWWWNTLSPSEQTAVLSAYKLAFRPAEDVLSSIERSGIRGRARTGIFSG